MDPTQTQYEEALMAIIEGIFDSTIIPDSHKESYVEYLQKNGLTEKMVSELEKIFQKEQESLTMSLKEKETLRKDLEDMIADEQKKNDQTQAEIVAAVDSFAEEKTESIKNSLEEIEQDITAAIEDYGKEVEGSEIDAIRAKLQNKK